MFQPLVRYRNDDVPVLANEEIEQTAERILEEFDPPLLRSPSKTDIDALAEFGYGLTLDFLYLSHCGIYMGMTVFEDSYIPVYNENTGEAEWTFVKAGEIILDKSLLADDKEPVLRFTLAHELGHHVYHSRYFRKRLGYRQVISGEEQVHNCPSAVIQCKKTDIFGGIGGHRTQYVCRKLPPRALMEHQANRFSACVNMPRKTVAMLAYIVKRRINAPDLFRRQEMITMMRKIYGASQQAAAIRLNELEIFSKGPYVISAQDHFIEAMIEEG